MKTEAEQSRAESAALRKELEALRASSSAGAPGTPRGGDANPGGECPAGSARRDRSKRPRSFCKTKSALSIRPRLRADRNTESGCLAWQCVNLFHNNGLVDNLDFPTYAVPSNPYDPNSSFRSDLAPVRNRSGSVWPRIRRGQDPRRKSKWISAEAFRRAALDGVNTGLFRLRTADMRLDWEHTSVIVGQDGLFISPLSPTSFATLAVPSMGYSGNLWAWTPQVRVEHRFDLSDGQNVTVQAGILDNLTGEPSYGTHRAPQAGELSGQPAYAARVGWSKELNGRPISLGTSGYYSRQNWGFDWIVDGWAGWRTGGSR